MTQRHPAIAALVAALDDAFAAARPPAPTVACLDAIRARLAARTGAWNPQAGRVPACAVLPDALAQARAAGPYPAAIADRFAAIEPWLAWRRRDGGPQASANIMEGHGNAMVIGPGGLEEREDVWLGFSLLAPQTRYPDHRHPPEEIYYLLSPGAFRQGEGPWFEPGPGGTLHNPPAIWHAMRSGAAPLLATWLLLPAGGRDPSQCRGDLAVASAQA